MPPADDVSASYVDSAAPVAPVASIQDGAAFVPPSVPAPQAQGRLSRAEREVMTSMLAGQTNEAIAKARGTSVHTVGNQVASIFRKLGVSSRAELAAHAEISPAEEIALPEESAMRLASFEGRERAVTEMVAAGLSNRAIATALGVSVSTVALALARACAKLGATRRVDLIRRYRAIVGPSKH